MTITVGLVDDSFFMRSVTKKMLESDPEIKVIFEASNGSEAIHKTKSERPNVLVMDLQMPLMDGFTALTQIMKDNPTPVIILSAYSQAGADITMECLNAGAVDFIAKPGGTVSTDIENVKTEILRKVKAAAIAKVERKEIPKANPQIKPSLKKVSPSRLVVIASSTGGPSALQAVLMGIPADIPAGIVIVQHMPAMFTGALAKRLDGVCATHVKEAEDGDMIYDGQVLLAPGGKHLKISPDGKRVQLYDGPMINGVKPSADPMFDSAAAKYGSRIVGVVLTGMGNDGCAGSGTIKKAGGKIIAQDQASSVVFGMPNEVIKAGHADVVASLDLIPKQIMDLVRKV